MKVDVLQVFVSTSAIFGIGILWLNLNQKVFATVCRLVSAPFEEDRKKNATFVLVGSLLRSLFLSDLSYEGKFFCQDCWDILLQEKTRGELILD